jgi:hypothetical protein
MPNQSPQPSFIPREATFAPGQPRERKGLSDLFVLVGIVLFVASIALAIGVFLYAQYLGRSSLSKIDQLERARAAFEPSLIAELTRLDDRMRAAGDVLGTHVAPSAVFSMLEQTTIGTVQYSSLDLDFTDPQRMLMKMEGVAGSVNAIALQADLFSRGGMVTSPIFSNINREFDGVHFELSSHINPVAINFAQLMALAGAVFNPAPEPSSLAPAPEPSPEPTAPPPTPFEDAGEEGGAENDL